VDNQYELSLAESLLFITHHPLKSRFRGSEGHLRSSLHAAVLLDLLDKGVISLEQGHVQVTSNKSPLNEIEKRAFEAIASSGKIRKTKYWIQYLFFKASIKKWDIWKPMIRKGLVGLERRKILGLIPYHLSVIQRTLVQSGMIRRLRLLIQRSEKPKGRSLLLIALIHSSDAYPIFSSSWKERIQLKKRVKSMLKEKYQADDMDQGIRELLSTAAATALAGAGTTVAS